MGDVYTKARELFADPSRYPTVLAFYVDLQENRVDVLLGGEKRIRRVSLWLVNGCLVTSSEKKIRSWEDFCRIYGLEEACIGERENRVGFGAFSCPAWEC